MEICSDRGEVVGICTCTQDEVVVVTYNGMEEVGVKYTYTQDEVEEEGGIYTYIRDEVVEEETCNGREEGTCPQDEVGVVGETYNDVGEEETYIYTRYEVVGEIYDGVYVGEGVICTCMEVEEVGICTYTVEVVGTCNDMEEEVVEEETCRDMEEVEICTYTGELAEEGICNGMEVEEEICSGMEEVEICTCKREVVEEVICNDMEVEEEICNGRVYLVSHEK